jgi:putative endonuclease
MAVVYILYTETIDKYYIGSCIDMNHRLKEHTRGKFANAFTKRANDWVIYFQIPNLEYTTARGIEDHIKRMKPRTYIQNLTKFDEMSQKLIQKYAGSSR